MLTTRLTRRRVDTLKPRKQTHHVRDPSLTGFGVRILPSGSKRYFLHRQSDGKRIWHAIGDAGAITLESARSRARALLAGAARLAAVLAGESPADAILSLAS